MNKLPHLLFCAIGISSQSFGQNSFSDTFRDTSKQDVESVPAENIVPLPADAVVEFALGDAPFYARLRSYARILDRAMRNDQEDAIEAEAKLLGLDVSDMKQLINQLQDYNRRETELSDSQMRELCAPILRNEQISSALAREAIRSADDNISIRNELAYTTIHEISKDFRKELPAILIDRIMETGARLNFSRVDQVRQVESMQRGDFVGVFTTRCNAL